MTSLMFDVPVINITKRSTPSAIPPCGGAPKVKAFNRWPNSCFCCSAIEAEYLKHFILQILFVYSDAAATDLDAVQHDIVGLRAHFPVFTGVQEWEIFGFRACEWVMHRAPLAFRRVKCQQRKVEDPQEFQLVRILDQFLDLCDFQPDAPEHGANNLPAICSEEEQVALLNCPAFV